MRVKKCSCLKVTVLAALITLIVINIKDDGRKEVDPAFITDIHTFNDTNTNIESTKSGRSNLSAKQETKSSKQQNNSGPVDSLGGDRVHALPDIRHTREESGVDDSSTNEQNILTKIQNANKEQVVENIDLFGGISNDSIVIVIQVHDRIDYLRQLIKSFSLAAGIDKALLVFSHDVWDEDLNTLVRSIDFSPSLQIFYPFSLQTHRHTFPGESPGDCPRDADKEKSASPLSCTNYAWPDIHGHYREAVYTQTKHHWWWKANQVFHGLRVTKDFNGLFLFLEEDHYVSEDFLHVLKLMSLEKKKSKVDILCLGTYLKKFNFRATGQQAEVTEWISAKHNMGMAFTRTEWNKMVACTDLFCKYDDYNWDWSLQHVSLNCMQEKLQVMLLKGPRVFHIGECGVHHKKSNCDSKAVSEKVKKIIKSAKTYFFPERISVSKSRSRKKPKLKKANGGWGDVRDHQLCTNFTRIHQ